MKRVAWKWLLPITQLILALACHVYEPHEFRVGLYRNRVVNNPSYSAQHSPALAGRISLGINFPALVLDYPLRNAYDPVIYQHNSEYTYIVIYPRDVGFFFGIVFFWCWVGWTLDRRKNMSSTTKGVRKASVAGLVCGVAFGALTAAYADQMIASSSLPQRQIGASGIAWACALVGYFAWRLMRQFTTAGNAARWSLAWNVVIVMTALLWIGGPFGATQSLGEFLRPSTVRMMPIQAPCTTGGSPPPSLIRIVDAQRNRYHLALQEVAVCTSVFDFTTDGVDFMKPFSHLEERWQRLSAGCCSYQYRRHVVVVVGGVGKNGPVIIEAALIQSRWDYLRLNWNKIWSVWSWPYPTV